MRPGWRIWLGGLAALVFALLLAAFPFDPAPLSAAQVRERVDRLNEYAATEVPHHSLDRRGVRAANLALFQAVEQGRPLSPEDSARYRVLYQSILKDRQKFLAMFDRELTVETDLHMDRANNVGGAGIAGAHDHHDASARANYRAMRRELEGVETARGPFAPFQRALDAALAHKDLSDILFHLATAPQTKSVLADTPAPQGDRMDEDFEGLLLAFKGAQFAPVNSPAYVHDLHEALDLYDDLVLVVDDRIRSRLSPFERTLAGRWDSWQSAPLPVPDHLLVRFPRKPRSS